MSACASCGHDPGFSVRVCPVCGAGPGSASHGRTVHFDQATHADTGVRAGACFIAISGPDAGARFVVERTGTLGRDAGCQVRIQDTRVSGRHALVRKEGSGFVYLDLEATNGSYLLTGGRRELLRGPHRLRDNDEIQVGQTVLRYLELSPGGRR